jgi:hypothetical protein
MRMLSLFVLLILILAACGGEAAIYTENDLEVGESLFSRDFEQVGTFETGSFGEANASWTVEKDTVALRFTVDTQTIQYQTDSQTTTLEIQVRPRGDLSNRLYGAACYLDGDHNGYAFLVNGEDDHAIARLDAGQVTLLTEWITVESTDHLRAVCEDNRLSLYRGDTLVTEVIDSTYPASEQIGSILTETPQDNDITLGEGLSSVDLETATNFSQSTSDLIIRDGHYQLTHTSDSSSYIWAQDGEPAQNVNIQVEAQPQSSYANNLYGVMCRVSEGGAGYAFLISNDGFGAIARTDGKSLSFIHEWVENAAIKDGQENNTIRAVCVDDYLALYVNDEFIGDAKDDRYPDAGQVGLIGGVFVEGGDDEAQATIQFDNLTVSAVSLES